MAADCIPNKLARIRPSDPPWFHNELRNQIRKRKRAHRKAKVTNSPEDWSHYRLLRNQATNSLKNAKTFYYQILSQKLKSGVLSGKDWWKTFKLFTDDTPSSIPPLIFNGSVFASDSDKANLFNKHFLDATLLDDQDADLPSLLNYTHHPTLGNIVFTPNEVQSILLTLKTGKACGPDGINNVILKELALPLSTPLCDLFNYSLSSGRVPCAWKEANVTPVFKKGDPSDVVNYRPISLLSTIGKSLEKLVHKHVYNFFLDHSTITSLQSGFKHGDSTVNQLVDIYNTFCKALDDGKEVRSVFCDISKAFDRVWHIGLLYKLKRSGITGHLFRWFENYLSQRKQRVVLPGGNSIWVSVKAGVPQGSILGPLLFLVFINDIVDELHSNVRLFADDTSLYIIVEHPQTAAAILNDDIDKIHLWAKTWLVTFNPNKTESLLASRKRITQTPKLFTMNHVPITEVTYHKHLGDTFVENWELAHAY